MNVMTYATSFTNDSQKTTKKKTASAFVSAKDKAEKKRKVVIFSGTSQTLRWV